MVAGPTTLAALLNSLQMGFRTLAIQKRSSEVWQLLGAIKTQFNTFGKLLVKTKEKLQQATKQIDEAAHRSDIIENKLKKVEALPTEDATALVPELAEGTNADDDLFEESV